MDIQLSISLLASSRTGSLERCLDSLRPLLAKIPSELIVVFTGTDERVRKIAERYTDCIIPFTWRDDFSAARNAGLKEAKGEWFLYIDDDEWFEDTGEICAFFQSGEYRRYSSACYVQRNYLSWSRTEYSGYHALRMAKRTKALRFEGPIHEELVLPPGASRHFSAYVHHYGYVKDLKSDAMKTSRNIPLLLEAIEMSPGEIKNYLQLTREYCLLEDWNEAEKWCRKGRQIAEGMKGTWIEGWLQAYLPRILSRKADKMQAAREAEAILQGEKPCGLASLLIYRVLIELYAGMGRPKEALQWGDRFEQTLSLARREPGGWAQQRLGELSSSDVEAPERLAAVYSDLIACALEIQDSKSAERFLKLLPWEEESVIQPYYEFFDTWEQKYGAEFLDLLLELPYGVPYLLVQKMARKMQEGQRDESDALLSRCLQEIRDPYLQQRVLREVMRWHGKGCPEEGLRESIPAEQICAFISRMDLEEWEACAEGALAGLAYTEIGAAQALLERIQKPCPLQSMYLERLILERRLRQGYLNGQALLDDLQRYCQCVEKYYRSQYREEMFEETKASLLPGDCRFALLASEALEKLRNGEIPEAARLFREAVGLYPPLSGVVREAIRQAAANVSIPAAQAGEEFKQLAVQMKEAVHRMIEGRQYAEALAVIDQLLPLLPADLEILKMRQEALREGAS